MAGQQYPQQPNTDAIYTNQITVQTPGKPVQLPSVNIPNGFGLVLKAKKTNLGTITFGGDAQDALNTGAAFFSLGPNEPIVFYIENASAIYIDAVVAGDGVEIAVEIRKRPLSE